jgi:hypothetical protein
MLRALDSDEPRPPLAYRVPWRVDRVYDRHPLVTNAGPAAVDLVRVLIDHGSGSATEHWGRMPAGDTAELCLCDADPGDTTVTIAWVRPENGVEYLWNFAM